MDSFFKTFILFIKSINEHTQKTCVFPENEILELFIFMDCIHMYGIALFFISKNNVLLFILHIFFASCRLLWVPTPSPDPTTPFLSLSLSTSVRIVGTCSPPPHQQGGAGVDPHPPGPKPYNSIKAWYSFPYFFHVYSYSHQPQAAYWIQQQDTAFLNDMPNKI